MTDQPPPPPPEPPPYSQPYGQPPGAFPGPYDPRWGYGPPGVPSGVPPQGPPEETTWAIFAYVGNALVGFLPALIVYLVKKNTSPFTRFHAAQSMNQQLTMLIHVLVVMAVCVPPAIVMKEPGFLVLLLIPYLELLIAGWAFVILGAVKAGKGQYYRFPTFFCFRMIR